MTKTINKSDARIDLKQTCAKLNIFAKPYADMLHRVICLDTMELHPFFLMPINYCLLCAFVFLSVTLSGSVHYFFVLVKFYLIARITDEIVRSNRPHPDHDIKTFASDKCFRQVCPSHLPETNLPETNLPETNLPMSLAEDQHKLASCKRNIFFDLCVSYACVDLIYASAYLDMMLFDLSSHVYTHSLFVILLMYIAIRKDIKQADIYSRAVCAFDKHISTRIRNFFNALNARMQIEPVVDANVGKKMQ